MRKRDAVGISRERDDGEGLRLPRRKKVRRGRGCGSRQGAIDIVARDPALVRAHRRAIPANTPRLNDLGAVLRAVAALERFDAVGVRAFHADGSWFFAGHPGDDPGEPFGNL